MPHEIRFEDGAAYDRFMGSWSQLAGDTFLGWLALPAGLRWLDVGCGTGAFTEMILDRCAPTSVSGIDPSEAQLAVARTRFGSRGARFEQGNAMALPFAADTFDVAVMPLVIFFVPDPALGVSEMARVVTPGGTVAAYAWDLPGGGFPYAGMLEELRAMDVEAPDAPSAEASRIDRMHELWSGAGLDAIETRAITVHRTFDSFDDYWATMLEGPGIPRLLAGLTQDQATHFRDRLRSRLPADANGHVTVSARANAVKGRVR